MSTATEVQRAHNRAWVKHARAYGATHVAVWFAAGEYDDATRVDVSIRQALGTLAEHVRDHHVDAVGTRDGADVTTYLSEYVAPGDEQEAEAEAEDAEQVRARAKQAARTKRREQRQRLRDLREQPSPTPILDGALALVLVWLVCLLVAAVAGYGVQVGTMGYAVLVCVLTLRGWRSRRRA